MAPVLPDAPVAQVEFSPLNIHKVEGIAADVDKVDGVQFSTLKGRMKEVGWRGKWGNWTYVFELTPGVHTFEIIIHNGSDFPGFPLTIDLNAHAGHLYRICAHNYDKVTTSLYIEDVSTGEVVSGHRPENVGVEPRRAGRPAF